MAPSRGHSPAVSATTTDDSAVAQQSESALKSARRNFRYLLQPGQTGDRPARLRTRALLRAFRYIGQFVLWRLVRWAKYAAVGFAVATLSVTAFGGVISGAGFVLAPTGIAGSIIAASVWGAGKYLARTAQKRWLRSGGDAGIEAREQAEDGAPSTRTLTDGVEMGPRAVPW